MYGACVQHAVIRKTLEPTPKMVVPHQQCQRLSWQQGTDLCCQHMRFEGTHQLAGVM
jgi:hypothetical protein